MHNLLEVYDFESEVLSTNSPPVDLSESSLTEELMETEFFVFKNRKSVALDLAKQLLYFRSSYLLCHFRGNSEEYPLTHLGF